MKQYFKISGIIFLFISLTVSFASGDDKYSSVKILFENGEFGLAKTKIRALAESGSIPLNSLLELSQLLEAENFYPEAIFLLDTQKQHHQNSTLLLERLAELYTESDQSVKAIDVYEELVKTNEKKREYWLQLGKIYSWNEQSEQAMLAYEKAVTLDPSDLNTIRQLSQQYQWNERPKAAFALQKVILRKNPGDLNLWKEHGIQAQGLNRNDEAIDAFKNIIKRDSTNAEAFFLLGETAMWSDRQSEAMISFKQVLKLEPENQKARFYLAQLSQYTPFQWMKAKKSYEHILSVDPYHQESTKLLLEIRQDYGPLFNSSLKYLDDSNNLQLTEVSVLHNRYVTSRWQLQAETIYRQLEEKKSVGKVFAYGQGLKLGGTWFVHPKTRFVTTGGYIRFDQEETFGLFEFQLQQTLSEKSRWPGQLFSSTYARYNQVLDGALAIRQKLKAKRIGQNIYWKPNTNTLISGDVQKSWYSDNNQKLELYIESEYRFFSGNPSLFLNAVYAYQDMNLFYPESEPYWTPKNFWTRSLGPSVQVKLGKTIITKVGYSLTQQTGNETANNWMANFIWQPNNFSLLRISYHDYGSNFYAYRSFEGQFSYRF